jgi:transcription elongation factor Elf1
MTQNGKRMGRAVARHAKPAPVCPSCGRLMSCVQSTASLEKDLEIYVHECRACGVTVL